MTVCEKYWTKLNFYYIFELGVFHRLATAGSFQGGPFLYAFL